MSATDLNVGLAIFLITSGCTILPQYIPIRDDGTMVYNNAMVAGVCVFVVFDRLKSMIMNPPFCLTSLVTVALTWILLVILERSAVICLDKYSKHGLRSHSTPNKSKGCEFDNPVIEAHAHAHGYVLSERPPCNAGNAFALTTPLCFTITPDKNVSGESHYSGAVDYGQCVGPDLSQDNAKLHTHTNVTHVLVDWICSMMFYVIFTVHSLIEGVGLEATLKSHSTSVYEFAIAIMLHKAIAGLAIGANLISSDMPGQRVLLFSMLFSVSTPLGMVLGCFVSSHNTFLLNVLVSATVGSLLFLLTTELLPTIINAPIYQQCKGSIWSVFIVSCLMMGGTEYFKNIHS